MEAQYEERHLSVGIVIEASALGIIGLLISLSYCIFNVRLRNNRLIKMSSPTLNLFIGCGGIFLSACCALFGLDYFLTDYTDAASAVCQARVGLLCSGSTLLFGPMFLKSWRVYRLFREAGKKRVIIKDGRLLLLTGVLVMVDLVLLVVWHVTDPLEFRPVLLFTQVETDNGHDHTLTPTTDSPTARTQAVRVHSCTSQSSPSWLAVFLFLKMALLCYGLFLSWRTRAVILPAMNDSRCIVVSSLTTVAVATLSVCVSKVLQDWPNAVYACAVMAIWLSTMVALGMAFVPVVSVWWRNPEAKGLRVSACSTSSSSPLFPLQELQEELGQVVTENEALKKSLEEKDLNIRQLQQHLSNAYRHLSHLGLNLHLIHPSSSPSSPSSSPSSSDTEQSTGTPDPVPLTNESPGTQDSHSGSGWTLSRKSDETNDNSFLTTDTRFNPSKGTKGEGKSNNYRMLENSGEGAVFIPDGRGNLTSTPGRGEGNKRRRSVKRLKIHDGSSGSSGSCGSLPSSSISRRRCSVTATGTQGLSFSSKQGMLLEGSFKALVDGADRTSDRLGDVEKHGFQGRYDRTVPAIAQDSATRKRRRVRSDTSLHHLPSSRKTTSTSSSSSSSFSHHTRRHQQRQRRRHSANSVASVERFTELRAAIAEDLQRARSLSNVLGNSVNKQLDHLQRLRCRRARRSSSSTRSREDLAESIVSSYGLDDTGDTFTFVSSFLSVPSLSDRGGEGARSLGNLSVLDSDALYPEMRQKERMTSLPQTQSTMAGRLEGGEVGSDLLDSRYLSDRRLDSATNAGRYREQNRRLSENGDIFLLGNDLPAYRQAHTRDRREGTREGRGLKHSSSEHMGTRQFAQSGDPPCSSVSCSVEARKREEELFSVQLAPCPNFVQAEYAHTRALCTVDTFI